MGPKKMLAEIQQEAAADASGSLVPMLCDDFVMHCGHHEKLDAGIS